MLEHESYLHTDYAKSFGEDFFDIRLEHSQGIILKRKIPKFELYDAIGTYPLFFCDDWTNLHSDLESNQHDLVSLVVVTDPFGKYEMACLENCFNTLVIPFKEHFVIDLSQRTEDFVNKHNRRYANKAIKALSIEKAETPANLSETWCRLYKNLVNRHEIKGIASFSEESLKRQITVPGSVVFYVRYDDEIIGMTVWYKQGNIAYYHLGAYSNKGYEMRASFAIFWSAIEYFRSTGLDWLDIGAGAGVQNDGADGLTRFKRGWSTDTRTVYLCGHIFDKENYKKISESRGVSETSYFPMYRYGEFD